MASYFLILVQFFKNPIFLLYMVWTTGDTNNIYIYLQIVFKYFYKNVSKPVPYNQTMLIKQLEGLNLNWWHLNVRRASCCVVRYIKKI